MENHGPFSNGGKFCSASEEEFLENIVRAKILHHPKTLSIESVLPLGTPPPTP